MFLGKNTIRTFAAALALLGASVSAKADVVFQSATFSGREIAAAIVGNTRYIGAAFTLTTRTEITAIGGQFGDRASGTIFGAIVSSGPLLPTFTPSDIGGQSLAHVVFGVDLSSGAPGVMPATDDPDFNVVDLTVPLGTALTLDPGTYGVVFGSGIFGASGSAALGDSNNPVGSPNLFLKDFFDDTWQSFNARGLRLFVDGQAVAAVPEPSTWAMMLIGFAGLGFARYKQSGRRAITT